MNELQCFCWSFLKNALLLSFKGFNSETLFPNGLSQENEFVYTIVLKFSSQVRLRISSAHYFAILLESETKHRKKTNRLEEPFYSLQTRFNSLRHKCFLIFSYNPKKLPSKGRDAIAIHCSNF